MFVAHLSGFCPSLERRNGRHEQQRNPELPEDRVAGGTEDTFDFLPGYGMMIRNGPEPPA